VKEHANPSEHASRSSILLQLATRSRYKPLTKIS